MALSLPLSCSKLQAAYEFRMVIRLDRDYLPNVERLYEFNHQHPIRTSIHQDRGIKYIIHYITFYLADAFIQSKVVQFKDRQQPNMPEKVHFT